MVLGIYGCGGLGQEVYMLARRIEHRAHRWDRVIFIDDAAPARELEGVSVYKLNEAAQQFAALEIAVAVGEPSVRERLLEKHRAAGLPSATLVYPDVYVDETTQIGEGCIISEGVYLSCHVTLGEGCYLQPLSSLGHNVRLGRCSVISSHCQLSGDCTVGDRFYIGFNGGVKNGLTVGNDVICSAGAIVFRDLPDEVIAVGNPARVMKKNEERRVFR